MLRHTLSRLSARLPAPLAAPLESSRETTLFLRSLLEAALVEGRGRAALEELRHARLVRVLEAARGAKVYEGLLSEEHVRTGRLDGIPPMTKAAFLERLDDTVAARDVNRAALERWIRDPSKAGQLFEQRYLVAMTSGTTGQVGVFLNDLESWARTRAVTFARIFRGKLAPLELARTVKPERFRMSFIVAAGGHYMTSLLAGRVPPLGRAVVDARVISIETPVPAMVQSLNQQRPHLVHSYPTLLELLAHEQRRGALRIQPEIITAGSEPLTPTCRQALEEAFPEARLVETYAATECVAMATGCPYGNLHVNEDACILEPIDAEGRLVAPGERAERVLVTNLLNTAQPLVRYEMTDQLELDPTPCGCGSPFGRVRVHGRSDDTFYLHDADGRWQAHPPIPLEIVFLAVPGLLQYQLVHERQNELRVRFVRERGAPVADVERAIAAQLGRYLADHGLDETVRVTLEPVEAIPRDDDSRKVRQILSRVPRPSAEVTSGLAVRERRRSPRAS